MNPETSPNIAHDTEPAALRVRCPECRKLYLVQFQDIQEIKPRFECVQCYARFFLSLPETHAGQEVIGVRMRTKEPMPSQPMVARAVRKEACPKCHKKTDTRSGECEHCGVVLERYRVTQTFNEGVPPHSPALAARWKKVVDDYANEELHEEFLRGCQRERNLPLAAAHYAAMRTLMPGDEMTEKRLREVEALGMTLAGSNAQTLRVRRFSRLWQMPLMAATLAMIVGMVLPTFRNILALGVALLFLALMLRFHFRGRI